MTSNEKGFTLIEAVLATALLSVGIMGMLKLNEQWLNNQRVLEIRHEIDTKMTELEIQLKSRDYCRANVVDAIKDEIVSDEPLEGILDQLSYKTYVDHNGKIITDKPILTTGGTFFNGKVLVTKIAYKMFDTVIPPNPDSPWDKESKFRLELNFEFCKNGDVVVREFDGQKLDLCPPNRRVKTIKIIERMLGFRVDEETKLIKEKTRHLRNPATGSFVPYKTSDIACSSNQDGLLEEAMEKVNLKLCVSEMKMMMMMGRKGINKCGIELKTLEKKEEFITVGTFSLPDTNNFVPNSLVANLVGGGGGGGGNAEVPQRTAGGGGYSGKVIKTKVNLLELKNCAVTVGSGGQGGAPSADGKRGNDSVLNCGGINSAQAFGGDPGEKGESGNMNDPCGSKGESSMFGAGSSGNCNTGITEDKSGNGAGGGGGGQRMNQHGKNGGDGLAKIYWEEYCIIDPDKVIQEAGENPADYTYCM